MLSDKNFENRLRESIGIEEIALDLIKGNMQITYVEFEKNFYKGSDITFEAYLPNGVTVSISRLGCDR